MDETRLLQILRDVIWALLNNGTQMSIQHRIKLYKEMAELDSALAKKEFNE